MFTWFTCIRNDEGMGWKDGSASEISTSAPLTNKGKTTKEKKEKKNGRCPHFRE